ncbi:hypothetical protein L7F22_064057 [Adiantum nelumboides]|nr:hypothetical protein [Adiantum nelumboides]
MHGQGEREEMVLADDGDVCDEQSSKDTELNLNADEPSAFGVEISKDGQLQAESALGEDEDKDDEKQLQGGEGIFENLPCLQFPWILKRGKRPRKTQEAEIESFQSLPYISPSTNSCDLALPPHKTLQTDKFLVGLIHEFLSLTLEKRATVQQLELFRRPYRLPLDILQFLLQYDGIFYVAKGATKNHVFLKEGYKEFDLLEKEPLLLWQERFVELAFSTRKPKERKASKDPSSDDAQSLSEDE